MVRVIRSRAAGTSAAADATGAVSGELMGQLIIHSMYPGKQVSDLQESDKQIISALSTLAAGLAGGVTGGSSASALAGAQAGKNAVDNNSLSLPKELNDIGLSQQSLAASMIHNGASLDELTAALVKNSQGQIPEGQDAVKGLLTAWAEFFGVPVSALAADGEMTPQRAAEILASGVPTSEAKLAQYVVAKTFLSIAKVQILDYHLQTRNTLISFHQKPNNIFYMGIALRKGDIYILEIQEKQSFLKVGQQIRLSILWEALLPPPILNGLLRPELVGHIQTQEGRQGGLPGKNEMVSEFVWYTSPLVGKL